MKTQPWYFRVCSWGRGWNLTAACIWYYIYIYNYYNDYHDDKPLDFWWSIFRPGCLASSSRGQEPVLLSLQLRFALPVHEFGHLMTRVAKTWFLWYVFSWIIQIQTTPVLNIAETFKCPLDKLRYSSRGVMVLRTLSWDIPDMPTCYISHMAIGLKVGTSLSASGLLCPAKS